MDYQFEFEVEVGDMCAGTVSGTCYIDGFADDWHAERIRVSCARCENGSLVWRDLPLPANHYLHPEILSYLESDCAMDIDEKLCDLGRSSYYGEAASNAEHRLGVFELLGRR